MVNHRVAVAHDGGGRLPIVSYQLPVVRAQKMQVPRPGRMVVCALAQGDEQLSVVNAWKQQIPRPQKMRARDDNSRKCPAPRPAHLLR